MIEEGNVLFRKMKYIESIKFYGNAIEIDPKNSIAWNNKGRAFYKLGNYKESVNSYNQALKFDPENNVIENNKLKSLKELNKGNTVLNSKNKKNQKFGVTPKNKPKTSKRNDNKKNGAISDWWNSKSKVTRAAIGIPAILGLIFIMVIGGIFTIQNTNNTTSQYTNNSTSNTTNTPSSTVSNAYNVFENQYVKFNYPNNFVVKDQSTNTKCLVYIYNGNPTNVDNLDPKYVGDISNVASDYMNWVTDPTKNINLNGISAIEFTDSALKSNDIFIPSKNLLFEIYTNASESTYNIIKNSLIIK